MLINVYYSLGERSVQQQALDLPVGTTIQQALHGPLADLMLQHSLSHAVWGRVVPPTYLLQAGDRIELVRPLRVDPMTARRERFAKQGIKKAGLFKTKREGAKQGY